MADFRKISVLVALVLILAGAASAQQPFNSLSCIANAAVPPTVRAEGLTELVGDIVLQCTGGVPTQAGALVPQLNFTVFLNTNITSRLIPTSVSTQTSSEVLLLVDEPNTSNNTSLLRECPTPFGGCTLTGTGVIDGSGVITPGPLPGPYNGSSSPLRPNVFRGIVSGNQVQFLGVPVDAPGTAGVRVFRFTNIRVNANGTPGGSGLLPGTIQALVSATGSTSLPINNPTQVVGYVQPGLTFNIRARGDITSTPNTSTNIAFAQCSSLSRTATTGSFLLQWNEGFPSSFKVRQSIQNQNVPGQIFNTESGFYNRDTSRGSDLGEATGVALAGTRLKAIFNNVPAGVSIYVTTKLYGATGTNATGTQVGTLVAIEGGAFLAAPPSNTDFPGTSGGIGNVTHAAAQIQVVNGSATAVWEVETANPLATENPFAGVWFAYTQAAANNQPPAGTASVAGSFAPTPTGAGITGATSASATAPIPRFVDNPVGNRSIFAIYLCKTNILFPYVTNSSGFDTGLAIANTSLDTGVFATATTPQAGTCTLFQFGDNANPSKASPRIEAGKVWAVLASDSTWFQANYIGYVIASCQFQLAHGFAFVSDFGAQKLAMGYLGLIIPEPANTNRAAAAGGEALDN